MTELKVGQAEALERFECALPALLEWFEQRQRNFPWRQNLDTQPDLREGNCSIRLRRNPYLTWLSEIMLQQTQAKTVLPYFERFCQRFPTLETLAEAEEEEVLKYWEGLGYYSRARSLLKCAREIRAKYSGHFPCDKADLKTLPGIGPYTAGAISSLAFDQAVSAVDGNVMRVVARFLKQAYRQGDPASLKACDRFLDTLWPELFARFSCSPGATNEAFIELGACLCQAKKAQCWLCPIQEACLMKDAEEALTLPLPAMRKEKREEAWTCLRIRDSQSQRYLVEQRPEVGLLAKLWQFPMLEGHLELATVEEFFSSFDLKVRCRSLREHRHVFSHLIWSVRAYSVELVEPERSLESIAVGLPHLNDLSFDWSVCQEVETTYGSETSWKTSDQLRELAFSGAMQGYVKEIVGTAPTPTI